MSDTPPEEPQDSAMSPGRRWAGLVVLSVSLLVITMDMTILNIALPAISADLNPTSDQLLWIVDVYSLVLAGLLVSVAAIADRIGRRLMLMLGFGIFALASFAVLFAESAQAVIVIRGLLGIGGAMIMPTTLSLIRVIFTDSKERANALSVWAAISGIGMVIGPLVGGFLLEHFSWHAAFLINVPFMVAALIASLILLPESRVTNPGRWDALAAVLSLVGIVALVWALKLFGKEASLTVPAAWIAMLIATLTLVWFTVRSLRSKNPLLELRLFKSRLFSAGILAAFGATFAMIGALLLIAQWLQAVNGSSPIEAGIQLMPLAITGTVASLLTPWLSRKIGVRSVLGGGLAIAAIGLFYIGASGTSLNLTHVIIALGLIGVGMGALAIGTEMVMGGVYPDQAGNAGAVQETAYEFAGTLGVTILGSISAIMYRADLAGSEAFKALQGADPSLAAYAEESIGAAVAIADELGSHDLLVRAGEAFSHSLQGTGFIGGAIMLAVAAVSFFLTPRGTKLISPPEG